MIDRISRSSRIGYCVGVAFAGFGVAAILGASPEANAPAIAATMGGFGVAMLIAEVVMRWMEGRGYLR